MFLRKLATLFVYAFFAFGAVFQGLFTYTVVVLFTRSPEKRKLRLRKCVSASFRFLLWLQSFLHVYKVRYINLSVLHQAKDTVFIANHPSLVDYVMIMAQLEANVCVMVKETLTQSFMRFVIAHLGYVHNKMGLDELHQALANKDNMLIFPEGTRTKDFAHVHFVRGAANFALRKQKNIIPIFIRCSEEGYLNRKFLDLHIPQRVPEFVVEVGTPIVVDKYINECATLAIAARHLTHDLEIMYQDYYLQHCGKQVNDSNS